MPRIQPINIEQAEGKAKDLLDGVKKSLGIVPNIFSTMVHSPAALESYLASSKALSSGTLTAQLREQLALTVAGENSCDYCASAHTALGKGAGLDDLELARNLKAESSNQQINAALTFAKVVVEKRGDVSNADLQKVRDAGYDDGEIIEIVAVVTHNIFTNYFNHIAETDIDFPVITTGEKAAA